MKIIAVDDENLARDILVDAIKEAEPQAEVFSFSKPSAVLNFKDLRECDIAFLDIQMFGMTGIELAQKIKDITPDINIIFATGYSSYASEAFSLHASGYLMKPVVAEDIRKEILNLRKPIVRKSNSRIRIQTFGNFEIFCDDNPVQFIRSKSKEILAYLVDKQGTGASYIEIANILWEDGQINRSRQKQLQVYISDMQKSLKAVDAENIIIKNKSSIMLDKSKVECDLYEFMKGDIASINSYKGQYMYSYEWAEMTVGYLDTHFI